MAQGRFPEFVKEAHARYPREPLMMALMFFESDRRTAGLGALDEKKRPAADWRNEVTNRKSMDYFHDSPKVHYNLRVDRRERMEYPPLDIDNLYFNEMSGDECLTLIRRPAVKAHTCVNFNPRDFHTRSGRHIIAKTLLEARKHLRAQYQEAACTQD